METTALAADDPLADLDFAGHEARLEEIERRHLQTRERVAASRERQGPPNRGLALHPPSPPMPESARWCACPTQPEPGESCWRCGKSRAPTNGTVKSMAKGASANGVEIEASEPVPWTEQDEAELRRLAQRAGATSWELGDVCCRCVPVAASRRPSGANELVRELAERVGIGYGTVRMARFTSHAWPAQHRVPKIAWTVFSEYTVGGAAQAGKRASLLRRLATDGPVTVARVREARGRKPRVAKVDPLDRILTRCERLAVAFDRLPSIEPTQHAARVRRLRDDARKLRHVADRLEALAG